MPGRLTRYRGAASLAGDHAPTTAATSRPVIASGTTPSAPILATSPITVTIGASSPSRSAASAMVARVASVTRWAGVVADWMHAAGRIGVAAGGDEAAR